MADGEAVNAAGLRERLPRIDPAEAAWRNVWLTGLSGGGLSAELAEAPDAPALRFSGGVWITPERIDGAPAAWLETAASPALPEALAAFSRLEPMLAALERAIGAALDPETIETPPPELTLRVWNEAHTLRITVAPAAQPPPRCDDGCAPTGAAGRAALSCTLALQGPLAPTNELESLAIGDLVTASSSRDGIKGWLSAPGVGTVRVRLRPGSARVLCEGTMDSTMDGPPPEPAAAGELPGGVRVKLRLELGAVEVTLGELAALAPGSVLTVEMLEDAPTVTVTAPGATLATGRLVALGEGYGVLVDHVAAQGASAA